MLLVSASPVGTQQDGLGLAVHLSCLADQAVGVQTLYFDSDVLGDQARDDDS